MQLQSITYLKMQLQSITYIKMQLQIITYIKMQLQSITSKCNYKVLHQNAITKYYIEM
jgi:hypothetical protein